MLSTAETSICLIIIFLYLDEYIALLFTVQEIRCYQLAICYYENRYLTLLSFVE